MSYYLIGGFVTGSGVSDKLEEWWDTYVIPSGSIGGGYLGCPPPTTPSVYFTWDKGSVGGKNNSFYTPYPQAGVNRGKLFWITPQTYGIVSSSIPAGGFSGFDQSFCTLNIPTEAGSYRIVTPGTTLENQYQSSINKDGIVTQYHFTSETDLWENGWKAQRGLPTKSDALATFNIWKSMQAASWGLNTEVPGNKAIIVASFLAYTTRSKLIQDTLGLSNTNMVKGAIVLAGPSTPFDDANYRNLVPIISAA